MRLGLEHKFSPSTCSMFFLTSASPSQDMGLLPSYWNWALSGSFKTAVLFWSFRCGTSGSAVSLQHQDMGSICSPAQWVKGSALHWSSCGISQNCGSNLNSICWGQQKKKKKMREKSLQYIFACLFAKSRKHCFSLVRFHKLAPSIVLDLMAQEVP